MFLTFLAFSSSSELELSSSVSILSSSLSPFFTDSVEELVDFATFDVSTDISILSSELELSSDDSFSLLFSSFSFFDFVFLLAGSSSSELDCEELSPFFLLLFLLSTLFIFSVSSSSELESDELTSSFGLIFFCFAFFPLCFVGVAFFSVSSPSELVSDEL